MKSTNQPPTEEDVRRYLLGQLTEEEAVSFETALLAEGGPAEERATLVEMTEDELVDDYHFARLERSEAALLEKRLATSERLRNKLTTAKQLDQYANKRAASPGLFQHLTQWLQEMKPVTYVYVAAMAALILVACLQFLYNLQLNRSIETAELRGRQATEERNTLEARMQQELAGLSNRLGEAERRAADAQANAAPKSGGTMSFASVLLSPGLVRSSGQTSRLILKGETAVEFRLDIGVVEFPSYNVTVSDANGTKLVECFQLKARETKAGAEVTVSLLTEQIKPGDYLLVLYGANRDASTERLDSYNVRLSR